MGSLTYGLPVGAAPHPISIPPPNPTNPPPVAPPRGPVLAVAVGRDASLCCSAGADGCVRRWRLPDLNVDPYDGYGGRPPPPKDPPLIANSPPLYRRPPPLIANPPIADTPPYC